MARLVDQMVLGMIGWVTFSWLLVLLVDDWSAQIQILATLTTIGLLISAELVSGYGTRSLRDKVSTFAYAGFLAFIIIVIIKVIEILKGS